MTLKSTKSRKVQSVSHNCSTADLPAGGSGLYTFNSAANPQTDRQILREPFMRAVCKSALLTSPQAVADRCGISCLVGVHTARRCATRRLTHFWLDWSLPGWPRCQTRAWGWGTGLVRRTEEEPRGGRERSQWRGSSVKYTTSLDFV